MRPRVSLPAASVTCRKRFAGIARYVRIIKRHDGVLQIAQVDEGDHVRRDRFALGIQTRLFFTHHGRLRGTKGLAARFDPMILHAQVGDDVNQMVQQLLGIETGGGREFFAQPFFGHV